MIIAIVIIICLLAMLTGFEIYRELKDFKITCYNVPSSKFDALEGKIKILFLSDLHNKVYGEDNIRLYEAVLKERPDLILIGGDMLVGKKSECYEPALKIVEKLPRICPVYYANGNHEQRMKEEPEDYEASYAEYKKKLEDAGVHFLENEFAEIHFHPVTVRIYGLEIPRRLYEHVGRSRIRQDEICRRIGRCDPEKYNILLAHNPDFTEEYKQWGADLILSGHLHGGIIRVPGIGGAVSPNFKLFPKYSGDIYREEDKTVVVSRGLGNHTVNIRLFNPAELIAMSVGGYSSDRAVYSAAREVD